MRYISSIMVHNPVVCSGVKRDKISCMSGTVRNRRKILRFWRFVSRWLLFLGTRQKKQFSYSRSGRVSNVLWPKIWDKIHHDSKAFNGLLARCKSAVFWQSERYNVPVSTRTEKDGFAGVSETGPDTVSGNGARIGLIFVLLSNTPLFTIYEVNWLFTSVRKNIESRSFNENYLGTLWCFLRIIDNWWTNSKHYM